MEEKRPPDPQMGPGGIALGGERHVAFGLVDGIGLEGRLVAIGLAGRGIVIRVGDVGGFVGRVALAEDLVLVVCGEDAVKVVHQVTLPFGELVACRHENVVNEGDEPEERCV